MNQAPAPFLEFKEEDHSYWAEGRRVPSVTECLKSVGLMPGLEFVSDEDVLNGIIVHRIIHFHNKGTLDESTVREKHRPYLDAYKDFCAATGFKACEFEIIVFEPQLFVAGTLDFCGYFPDGTEGIGDAKSGIAKPWTRLQTAGYDVCKGPSAGRGRRRFGLGMQGGRPKFEEYKNPNERPLFLSAVALHHWKINNRVKV